MKTRYHFPRLLPALNVLKFLLVVLMVILFINFNAKIAHEQSQTQAIAQSTNRVVNGQRDILNAIKQVTDDTHTTAAQQTAIIICMLQVPVDQRTTNLQEQCRTSVVDASNDAGTSKSSTQKSAGGSSSNSSSNTPPAQSNSSQNQGGNSPSGGSSQPGFFQRNIVQPIKNLINAL